MATHGEKLADSLQQLKELQETGLVAIKTGDLTRVHRERLLKYGFIREVLRGWYIIVPQFESQGDSSSWYISYWDFCARYLDDRYGEDYCVSAEQSLLLHSGDTTVPKQLIIWSNKGNNSSTSLLFDSSLFAMKSPMGDKVETEMKNGVRIASLASSIVYSSPGTFQTKAADVKIALMMIKDASDLLGLMLKGGHSTIAGRIAGAYRMLGNGKIADEITKTMKEAGYDVRETNPFERVSTTQINLSCATPHSNRIRLMWYEMRDIVLEVFPKAPGLPSDKKACLDAIEELYTSDAYHSLSIERYTVTIGLIERVKSGDWNRDLNELDKKQADALAARGYYLAFNAVMESIEKILNGVNPGDVASSEHGDWYRAMFGPSVRAGLLSPTDLAGYRNQQVYIGQSRHIPMSSIDVRDALPTFFDLLRAENNPGVRAVLGHFIFAYIHPYMDGNGRVARFLMNLMLISGGYPWTVIPVERRSDYMNALEVASVQRDIMPFAMFIAGLMGERVSPDV